MYYVRKLINSDAIIYSYPNQFLTDCSESAFSGLALGVVHIFVLHDFGEHARDLLIQQGYQLVVHVLIQLVGLAEFVCKGFGSVTLVHNNTLHFVLAHIHVHVQLRVGLVDTVANIVQLLVNEVLWIIAVVLLGLLLFLHHRLTLLFVEHGWVRWLVLFLLLFFHERV